MRVIFVTDEFVTENKKSRWLKQAMDGSNFIDDEADIAEAFSCGNAIVATDDKDNLLGFMIWQFCANGLGIEVSIAEVKPAYRKQGILKMMLTALSSKFINVNILLGQVVSKSEPVFISLGWHRNTIDGSFGLACYYKIIKPTSMQHDVLLNGLVISFFSKTDMPPHHMHHIDLQAIATNPTGYPIKYFQLDVDDYTTGKLRLPIITPFNRKGYVGIYFNQKLICYGEIKFLFTQGTYHINENILILDKFVPLNPTPFIFLSSKTDTNNSHSATFFQLHQQPLLSKQQMSSTKEAANSDHDESKGFKPW